MAKQYPEFHDYTKRLNALNSTFKRSAETSQGSYIKAEKDLVEVTKKIAEAREKD